MSDQLRTIFADWIEASATESEYNERTAKVKEFYPDFNY